MKPDKNSRFSTGDRKNMEEGDTTLRRFQNVGPPLGRPSHMAMIANAKPKSPAEITRASLTNLTHETHGWEHRGLHW